MEQVLTAEGISEIIRLGIVGSAFIFMLRWVLMRFDKSQQRIYVGLTTNTLCLIAMQKQFLTHDLTVSGLNPSAGADLDERARLAIRKYDEIQTTLNTIYAQIKRELEVTA